MAESNPHATRPGLGHGLLLWPVSASVLAYEILLMRMLSISQWHHVVYMVISMALLGYGAAGSLLFLLFESVRKRIDLCLIMLAGGAAVSFSLAFGLSQRVGLDPLLLIWQWSQWWNMLLTYVIMALPFLFAGGVVGIILTAAGEQAHRMYAVDLFGAGSGVLAVIPALYLGPPWSLVPALGCLVLAGALLCGFCRAKTRAALITVLAAVGVLALVHMTLPPRPKIHHTKELPMTLALPDARIEATRVGPMGMIQVVGSRLIRDVPGLSLNYGLRSRDRGGVLPEQKAMFLDAGRLGPITRFNGDLDSLGYLDFTTMALPYHMRDPQRVLVVGGGGGTEVLLGLRHKTPSITVLEINRQVLDLLQGPFAAFSGHLYSRPQVRPVAREARQFLRGTSGSYDLISLSLLDSPATSIGGLHSAAESYLYTTEAFREYLSHLTDDGILCITRWLKLPPRDSLRVMATAMKALAGMGISKDPEKRLFFIRSWKTTTILLSKRPFNAKEILRATAFCKQRSFDLAYYAGMGPEQANRYDVQDFPRYYEGAKALCGPGAKSFLRNYVFDVTPTTDDRPYFSHFFRWDSALTLFHSLQREWLPMVELGYVFIVATLVQSLLASGVLILVPLFFLRRRGGAFPKTRARPGDVLAVLVYFGLIGLGFMLLEMTLLPRYTLLLAHPVYSAAVVLGTLLVFAGWGSLRVKGFQSRSPLFLWVPVLVVALWVGVHWVAGEGLLEWALGKTLWVRLAVGVGMLAILSFFMGWPFPWGLRLLAGRSPGLVPWAWGVNGCASVVGAVLGKLLAIGLGFRNVMVTACLLYVLGVFIFQRRFGKVPR